MITDESMLFWTNIFRKTLRGLLFRFWLTEPASPSCFHILSFWMGLKPRHQIMSTLAWWIADRRDRWKIRGYQTLSRTQTRTWYTFHLVQVCLPFATKQMKLISSVVYLALTASKMCDQKRKMFLNVIRSFPQYNFLWKWETEVMEDKPSNLMLAKWLPQQDILGHSKTKLFISHVGQSSFQESLCHQKPVVKHSQSKA